MTSRPQPPSRAVLVVANSTDSDAGYVGEHFEHHGWSLRTVFRDQGGIPEAVPSDVQAVLLLGSEWSVHAPLDPAARDAECALVHSAQATGVPVLGLCYGAQVVAAACGGGVSRALVPEVGLVSVSTDDEDLVPSGPWSAFHVDVIEPPPGAVVVARNACGAQAFVLPGVLAVQFHPEVRPDKLADWTHRFPDLLAQAGLDRDRLLEEARAREPAARAAAATMVDGFLGRVAATAHRPAAGPTASRSTNP
jgi:GMP synthase-like glutamine amidotransferase